MFTPGARIDLGVGNLRQQECPLKCAAPGARVIARGCSEKGGRHGN